MPGEAECRGIGEHVPGIGEQRQRAGEQAPGNLGCHEADGQQQRPENAPLIAMLVTVVMCLFGCHLCGSAHAALKPAPGHLWYSVGIVAKLTAQALRRPYRSFDDI